MSRQRPINSMKCVFPAKSINEGLSRSLVAAFVSQLDPTVGELADLRTAVSEAVTNCIVHAYPDRSGEIYISCEYDGKSRVTVRIRDKGIGIEDIEKARLPLFTTSPESERSGMGFTIMESFTDRMTVKTRRGGGTVVTLVKTLGRSR